MTALLHLFLGTVNYNEGNDSGGVGAIVVLGRGPAQRSERIEGVFSIWQEPLPIFVSGMNDAIEITTILADGGIPKSSLKGERCSQSTVENAEFTSTLLSPKGIRNIILISDRAHLLRASLVFKTYGFQVIPYGVPTVENQFFNYDKVMIDLREYGGLMYGYFLKQFQPKSAAEIEAAHIRSEAILEKWKCEVVPR